jgi:diacylglycerol kinase family enzyme
VPPLDGFTITAALPMAANHRTTAAGVRNDNANPTLTNVHQYSGNSASSYGGVMYNDNAKPDANQLHLTVAISASTAADVQQEL